MHVGKTCAITSQIYIYFLIKLVQDARAKG